MTLSLYDIFLLFLFLSLSSMLESAGFLLDSACYAPGSQTATEPRDLPF